MDRLPAIGPLRSLVINAKAVEELSLAFPLTLQVATSEVID
jgi:hypothetical protein